MGKCENRTSEIHRSQGTGVYQTSGLCDDFESYRLLLALLTMLSVMQRFLLIHVVKIAWAGYLGYFLKMGKCENHTSEIHRSQGTSVHQTSGLYDDFESYRLLLGLLTTLSAMQRFLLIHECAMHMKNSCTYQVIVLHGKGCPSLTVSSTHRSRWDTVPPAVWVEKDTASLTILKVKIEGGGIK